MVEGNTEIRKDARMPYSIHLISGANFIPLKSRCQILDLIQTAAFRHLDGVMTIQKPLKRAWFAASCLGHPPTCPLAPLASELRGRRTLSMVGIASVHQKCLFFSCSGDGLKLNPSSVPGTRAPWLMARTPLTSYT